MCGGAGQVVNVCVFGVGDVCSCVLLMSVCVRGVWGGRFVVLACVTLTEGVLQVCVCVCVSECKVHAGMPECVVGLFA